MVFVIIGVIVSIVSFLMLGYLDGGWKINNKQWLSVLGLAICLLGFFTKIPANHVGIVYSPFGGTKEITLSEGFHKKSPLDKIYKISTETKTTKVKDLTTQTKDAQYVTSILDIKYKVNNANAFKVFKQFKTLKNMSENLIVPATQRVLENITTKYNVIDILGEKRSEIYIELDKGLKEEFTKYGVEFVTISIIDMDAGKKLEAAITAEAVAKKEVETAEQNLEKAKKEAEKNIVEAEAEKKVNELRNKSLSDKVLQQMWIEKWNGKLPTYYGGDANMMIGIGKNE